MDQISTFLWFDGQALEAAEFYTALFPDSRITDRTPSPIDYPGGAAGQIITVAFTLDGRGFIAMNGGPGHPFTDAVSLSIDCDDQAEVDRYWDALSDGGMPVACGWIKDRFGLSWQVTPRILPRLLADPDRAKARRVMEAMTRMVKLDVAAIEAAAKGDAP
ncbi:VOC family protein (plasmid) [Paracoccus liaowanqingii]|uniref:VOC family protein n=1 Tax=Paracoccus liaowanqingii TaxID=2560053 RepID=A0A4Y5SVN9_9RHOB|nr:VOC family protein [Paracoccus liaowanqingii]QDA36814.1 VOC family protein [Paracoccus liaowanqingii]